MHQNWGVEVNEAAARFARCSSMTYYKTYPPVNHEQSVCFCSTKSRSAWTCPKFCNSSTASTSLHPSFPISSPTSSPGYSTEIGFQGFKTKMSRGSSSIWTKCVSILCFTPCLLNWHRLSTLLILPVLHIGSVYMNLENYAAPGNSCRNRTCLIVLFRPSTSARCSGRAMVFSMKSR